MADALRAGQHGIHELFGWQRVGIAPPDHLEPFHGVAGGILDAGDVDPADFLVGFEDSRDVLLRVAVPVELVGELDRVVDRKLRAGADGEVRRMGRITHQHDMRLAVEVAPLAADQAVEVEPGGTAQVAGIRHELGAVEHLGKQVLAEVDRALLVHLAKAVLLVGLLGGFHDEGRGLVVELVDMGLEPAVIRLAEVEGEGVVELVRTEPDIAVGPRHQVRLEDVRIAVADLRVEAVRGDDEIGVRIVEVARDVGLEDQFDAQRLAATLQDVQELLAADADEAVAGSALPGPLEPDFDVVPVVERILDLGGTFRVPGAHRLHRGIGEDDPPAEGIIWPVALDDGDRVPGVLLLHQEREIEPGGAAADADDAHEKDPPDVPALLF